VESGPCTLANSGTCFRSPNYPSDYGVDQTCTITTQDAVTLSVTAFSTEQTHDKLTVNGVQYSGTTGPGGVQVSAGSTITWTSDGSVTRTGFQICGTGSGAFPPNVVPAPKRSVDAERHRGAHPSRPATRALTKLTFWCFSLFQRPSTGVMRVDA
jgi:hypothetical protein